MKRIDRKVVSAALAGLGFTSMLMLHGATANAADLAGTWRGGGSVSFGSNEERVRCKARYRRTSSSRYRLKATCTTGSTRVTQTAVLRRVGKNQYEGRFRNSEYGITGAIYVAVKGSRQNITLESGSGSADINLRKR